MSEDISELFELLPEFIKSQILPIDGENRAIESLIK